MTRGTFDRAAIAEAIHRAVCQVTDSDGWGMCAYYARAGAVVATVVTRQEYVFNAGGVRVAVGDRNGDGDLWLAMEPAESGYNGMEFHAWFARKPAWVSAGQMIGGRAGKRVELVDLSLRHLQRNAELLGMPWRREPLPAFFWDQAAKLDRLRVQLRPDPKTTMMCIDIQPMDQVKEIARLALKSL